MATVWKKLLEYRLSLGLSQTEFAKLYLGNDDRNSQMIIYRNEKGKTRKLPLDLISKITSEIGSSVDNILDENLESIFDKPIKTDFSRIEPLLSKILINLDTIQLEILGLKSEIDKIKKSN